MATHLDDGGVHVELTFAQIRTIEIVDHGYRNDVQDHVRIMSFWFLESMVCQSLQKGRHRLSGVKLYAIAERLANHGGYRVCDVDDEVCSVKLGIFEGKTYARFSVHVARAVSSDGGGDDGEETDDSGDPSKDDFTEFIAMPHPSSEPSWSKIQATPIE